jgi:hypothetical protein
MLKPRDHYKTTFISIGYALYNICEQLLYPVLIVSLAKGNTRQTYSAIKRHLETNKKLIAFYGYLIDDERPKTSNQVSFKFQERGDKDPGLYCATFGSKAIMGTHPRLAILDDIEDRPLTPSLMRDATQLIDASLLPAIGVYGKLIIVGTIKGWTVENDIYLYCESKGIFSVYRDPAVYLVNDRGYPILHAVTDEEGNVILGIDNKPLMERTYGLPPMKDVKFSKKRAPRIDPNTGKQLINKRTNRKRWKMVLEVQVLRDLEKYRSIYPEVYTIEEIIKKRIELRDPRKGGEEKFWSEYFLQPANPQGKYFKKDRVNFFPTASFPTVGTLVQHLKDMKMGSVLWVDPGGKGKHGIAIAVCAFVNGYFYVLELVVERGGIPAAAETIADLIVRYNVKVWGVESNFLQKETYADSLDEFVLDALVKRNKVSLYSACDPHPNRGDKIRRIQAALSVRLGRDGTPPIFFVNQYCTAYDQFINELTQFPDLHGRNVKHEFDLLDAIASCNDHLLDIACFFFWESGAKKRNVFEPEKKEFGSESGFSW